MCLFQEYAKLEWGDDVYIFSGWAEPIRFICKDCKLHPEGRGDFHTIAYESDIPHRFLQRTVTGTRDEASIAQIKMHIEEHINAGHKVHPSVNNYLYREMVEISLWHQTLDLKDQIKKLKKK